MLLIFKKNWHYFCLILIFIWAILLRTVHIEKHIDWKSDNSRDVLVARHIAVYHQNLTLGPYMAGLRNIHEDFLRNSSVYYYFLGLLYFFTQSSERLHVAVGIFGAISTIFAYGIGKELKSKELGLIMALFTANSYFLTLQARAIWQPFLLPTFICASIYLLLKIKKDSTFLLDFLFITITFVSQHIHISFFTIAVPLYYFYFKVLVEKPIKYILVVTAYLVLQLSIYLAWIVQDFSLIFTALNFEHTRVPLAINLFKIIENTSALFFADYYIDPKKIIYIIFFLIILVYIKNKSSNFLLRFFIFILLSTVILPSLYSHGEWTTYHIHSVLIFCFLVASIVSYTKNNVVKYFIAITITYSTFFGNQYYISNQENQKNLFQYQLIGEPSVGKFLQYEEIAKIISNDMKKRDISLSEIGVYDAENNIYPTWSQTNVLYFLERENNSEQPILQLTNKGNSLALINTQPKYYYFICPEYWYETNVANKYSCMEYFNKTFPEQWNNQPELVNSNSNQGKFHIFFTQKKIL